MTCAPWPGVPTANWSANTYTTPWLSVRTVQPERPKPCLRLKGVLVALVTCFCDHVSPPSVEVATISGCGAAKPDPWLRNEAQQMYTWPKKGLLAALSAQICSLSLNVVDDCRDAMTGAFQLLWSATIAGVKAEAPSMRETAIASSPLNASSLRVEPKLDVRGDEAIA